MTAPTPPLTDEQVAEIRARVEAATEGPWFVEPCGDFGSKTATIPGVLRERYGVNGLSCGEDFGTAEFIAHARTDVPALLAEVERLRAVIAKVEALPRWTIPAGYVGVANALPAWMTGPTRAVVRWDDLRAALATAEPAGTGAQDEATCGACEWNGYGPNGECRCEHEQGEEGGR